MHGLTAQVDVVVFLFSVTVNRFYLSLLLQFLSMNSCVLGRKFVCFFLGYL